MKVNILRTFVYDKVCYAAEEQVDFSEEQVEYLNSTSLGQIVEALGEKEELSEKDYEKLNKKKLVEIARNKDIQVDESMTKKEIIEELV